MKKLIISLFLVGLLLPLTQANAQSFGLERRVPLKNLYLGAKVGTNALGMRYTNMVEKDKVVISNPSALWQGEWLGCLIGGITVERTLPHFSYGLEGVIMGLDAKAPDTLNPTVKMDSAWLIDIRVPIRVRFFEDYACSPYLVLAPCVGSYLTIPRAGVNGHSEWNSMPVEWGKNNIKTHHVSLLAGIGMDVKIPIGNYEAKLRIEGNYQLGISNLLPEKKDIEKTGVGQASRKTRGFEATVGICFPLFSNPHYSWLM